MTSIRAVHSSGAVPLGRIDLASQSRAAVDGGFQAMLSAQSAALLTPQASVPPQDGPAATSGDATMDSDAGTSAAEDDGDVREAFQSFVGQTLFGMMLKEMRKSVHKTPYFHGGMAEEVFQQQLDTVLAEKLADASGERLANPMYELFQLRTKGR